MLRSVSNYENKEQAMQEGPDISRIGALIGDPARANMLSAMLSGKALTATELSGIAGVTLQTASSHLSRLEDGGLITQKKQGRHRYFALADDRVAQLLESLMGFAAERGHMRFQAGPKDPALRKARVCYNHLAGDYGVQMLDSLKAFGAIQAVGTDELVVTAQGETRFAAIGIPIANMKNLRRPVCRHCLDWSERRMHLAGALGEGLLNMMLDKGWAHRDTASRAVLFTTEGERQFHSLFPSAAAS
jgi:DNA-binding transcriptional ArsR family regulator